MVQFLRAGKDFVRLDMAAQDGGARMGADPWWCPGFAGSQLEQSGALSIPQMHLPAPHDLGLHGGSRCQVGL